MKGCALSAVRRLGTLGLLAVMACPSANTVRLRMDRVELVDGSLRGQAFDLAIFGQGFGLESVSYDLIKTTGVAEKGAYQLRIVDQAGAFFAFAEGKAITVKSPQELRAEFILQTPLEFGEYDLELTLASENGEPIDTLRNGVKVIDPNAVIDAGIADQGLPRDLGLVIDSGTNTAADAGSVAQDSGATNNLGPWMGDYRYRREVMITNLSGDDAPGGITIRIPIPHGDHSFAGQAERDASDVAIFWNSQEMAFQWEDQGIVSSSDQNTLNELVMIAQTPATDPIAPGLLRQAVIVLYFGDTNATPNRTDSVFSMVERFDAELSNWNVNTWTRNDCPDRGGSASGSYCIRDSSSNPTRRTLASPAQANLSSMPANNTSYEASFWIAGTMVGIDDLLYFAYGASQSDFVNTHILSASAYSLNPPQATVNFEDNDGSQRSATGWKLPDHPGQSWVQSRVQFTPRQDQPGLHFRFISADGRNEGRTQVALDDLQIRMALLPGFQLNLGPIESLN
jgi:hypothetical protein